MFDSFIYEEEIEFYENEVSLEKALYKSNMYIDLMFFESPDELSKTEKFKAMIHRVIEMFKAFINKCKEYLNSAISKFTGRVTEAYTKYKLREIIHNFDNSIAKAERLGFKTFKFIDMKALHDALKGECDEYSDIINKFVKMYIKRAAPRDAEKMIRKSKEISEKYDKKIKEIIENKKEYHVREAKKVAKLFETTKDAKVGGFTDIVDVYITVCDNVKRLVENTMNSLDQYSEDTGYIQNAKTLQDIIHNSCIRLQVHSAECVTAILQYGIPLLCGIDKMANTHEVDTGRISKDGLKIYDRRDLSTVPHQKVRETLSNASSEIGTLSALELKGIRKATRKQELKDWKFAKGESPLTFDKDPVTTDNIIKGTKEALPYMAAYEVINHSKK